MKNSVIIGQSVIIMPFPKSPTNFIHKDTSRNHKNNHTICNNHTLGLVEGELR